MRSNIRLEEVLVAGSVIAPWQLDAARAFQKEHPDLRIGQILVDQGALTPHQLVAALAKHLHLPLLDFAQTAVEISAVERIPRALAQKYRMLAVRQSGNVLTVAVNDPLDYYAIEDIRQLTDTELAIVLAEQEPLVRAIDYYYAEVSARQAARAANDAGGGVVSDSEFTIDMTAGADAETPIINLLNTLVQRAVSTGASDIHIEPFAQSTAVRMRIDGAIVAYLTLQRALQQPLIARVKIMASLDIAEHRIPQDGHFRAKLQGGADINVRVSILPTVFGEKAVLRLLTETAVIEHADHFGMADDAYARFAPLLDRPNGIIYLTGPTGSGKTTTLYMVLQSLAQRPINISTVEDPVERNLDRINQTQINPVAGLTFEAGLRALLRQDPDVLMVGETRDAETASISVRAAITGHMVFSTLHTNDALSSILRLRDMGVEPYLIANSVVGLVAQRLMRRVCPDCGREVPASEGERALLGPDVNFIRRGAGCPRCSGTGYRGRLSIHEIVVIDKALRRMIAAGAPQEEMLAHARKNQGMRTLRESALELVRQGLTTPEELVKVTYYED